MSIVTGAAGTTGATGTEWLDVRGAGGAVARLDLAPGPLRIGRSPHNTLVLRDSFASAEHAEIGEQRGGRFVRDLGSTNGTKLNGQPLKPGRQYPLRDGDVVEIGDSLLTYRRPTASRAPAVPSTVPANGVAAPDRTGRAGAADTSPVPTPARRRWTAPWRLLLRLALAILALLLVVAGVGWLLAPARVIVLVMGSDARPDELQRGVAGRTDTMLAVVADRAPRASLISIPRDLWLEIPGYGAERINTAYAIGGPETAERVVSDLLGVPVERHLLIGLQGVRDIVDAAGGIEIDVPRPIYDDAYPTDDYGTVVVDIPAGRQQMDGETALRYARTRHQDNDFGRMARQQQVLLALRNKLIRPTSWWRIPAVLGAVRESTRSNLGPLDLVTLGLAFGGSGSEPDRLSLELGLVQEFAGGGGAYLLRPTPALKQRVGAFVEPARASVEVLNGTETAGLAMRAAERLRGQQMEVASVGNAPRHPESTVEVSPGLTRAGRHVAEILELPREAVRENPSLPPGVDVRVTLGG